MHVYYMISFPLSLGAGIYLSEYAKKGRLTNLVRTCIEILSDEDDVDESIVWVYISYLRQKLQAIKADISILGEKGGDFCLELIREE